jgi:uncharacterized protein YbjT (DUF2867 family)
LIAGATGYLGAFVAQEFKRAGFYTKLLVRHPEKAKRQAIRSDEIFLGRVTEKSSLKDCCANTDVVFSSIGITRQKEGLTYMDVDFQGNLNLLEEAKRSGVKKFIYVSVLNGDRMRHLKICNAKEKFVDMLQLSGLDYCVVRPNGYFSDMAEFYKMAETGRVFLVGSGRHKINPIDGADLAKVCVEAAQQPLKEIGAGGPDIFSHEQIAELAFSIAGKNKKITHIPQWMAQSALHLLKTFTSSKTYGPIEFLMAMLSQDMIAPPRGTNTLKEYFEEITAK